MRRHAREHHEIRIKLQSIITWPILKTTDLQAKEVYKILYPHIFFVLQE